MLLPGEAGIRTGCARLTHWEHWSHSPPEAAFGVSYEDLKENGGGGELGQNKRVMDKKFLQHE